MHLKSEVMALLFISEARDQLLASKQAVAV
jgi:hypothetical protein